MATKNDRRVPARAVHPGEILGEELKERGIKQKEFAQMIDVQPTHLNEFIKGKRNMNEDLALKLEKSLGIPFKTWMNLHNGYIYDCKAIDLKKDEDADASNFEEACSRLFNLKLLYSRIGLAKKSCVERVKMLQSTFTFDLLSSENLNLEVAGRYKYSEKVQIDEKNMLTWLLLNWKEINKITIETQYIQGNALKAASEIAQMANDDRICVDSIEKCLYSFGIYYAHVAKVDKAPIDAYSTIVNEHPVITVTYRYNDMDKLVFDILHELCHIDRHLSNERKAFISIEGVEYSSDPCEKEANEFARQMLIPDTVWNDILKTGCTSLSPYKIVKTIAVEAHKRGISSSIAVSRYKHDTNWYRTSSYKSSQIH